MDKLGELKVFLQVVETGGFSGAARAASLTPSGVSKLVARMEDRLGVRLFHRSPRKVTPTREGELFYGRARGVIEALEEAEAAVSAAAASATGFLRVHATPTFATRQLAPVMPIFLAEHPTLTVEFVLSNEPLRMLDSGIDVAIQSGGLTDSSLVVRRIAGSRWRVCAAPDYLARRGTPAHPLELRHHDCLNFTSGASWSSWPFDLGGRAVTTLAVPGRVMSNQGEMLLALARAGGGIVRLAEFHIAEDLRAGRLVSLLDDFLDEVEEPIYAVYHSRRHLSPRVRAFVDFMSQRFGDGGDWSGTEL